VNRINTSEGFPIARFFMVLASLSPLFILWAVRGVPCISDITLVISCLVLVIVPNIILGIRLLVAVRSNDTNEKVIGHSEDHRDHLLVYLFAVLMPLWDSGMNDSRSVYSVFIALGFILFLFWHLNLHYMNIVFAIFGYRVFSVRSEVASGDITSEDTIVIITKRNSLPHGMVLNTFRISNSVFWDKEGQ